MFVKRMASVRSENSRSFLVNLLSRKFYVDELYEVAIQNPVARLSSFLHQVVELNVIDRFVNQTGSFVVWVGKNIRYMQTGNVGAYLFFMVISIILILVFNLFK
jgi:NADH-quinone oxidoreductase subunit L